MTQARCEQVCVESTPYYHCISRCVRRAFLCGRDRATGKDFDHRKPWLVARIKQMAALFAIDICAYAVMSNHYHLVVRIVQARALGWSDEEVQARVKQLFRGAGKQLERLTGKQRHKALSMWRRRLCDLSWFMRCVNEHIARQANHEDGCRGRFWEGRFKSQALLDEGALFTCMSYVDLNPVRAGIAKSLEASDFTSIQERLFAAGRKARKARKGAASKAGGRRSSPPADVAPMKGDVSAADASGRTVLPIDLGSYVELLEHVGSALRDDGKTGRLPASSRRTLERLGLDPDAFLPQLRAYGSSFFTMVGHRHLIDAERDRLGLSQVRGIGAVRKLYAA